MCFAKANCNYIWCLQFSLTCCLQKEEICCVPGSAAQTVPLTLSCPLWSPPKASPGLRGQENRAEGSREELLMHSCFCHSMEHRPALTKETKPEPMWRSEQIQEQRPVGNSHLSTGTTGSSPPECSDSSSLEQQDQGVFSRLKAHLGFELGFAFHCLNKIKV